MIAEIVGGLAVIIAAVITGFAHRIRRENNDAHGRSLQKLDRIINTVEHIDEQVDEIAEWQVQHEEFHAAQAQ